VVASVRGRSGVGYGGGRRY